MSSVYLTIHAEKFEVQAGLSRLTGITGRTLHSNKDILFCDSPGIAKSLRALEELRFLSH
ncbi:endoplasmin homolog [Physcomitrium patens]|uniref:Uncharacterized protein n=1 Tax=Physcomitrium patens TaxID=3218 RepID=A0A7I4FB99_PHYPA